MRKSIIGVLISAVLIAGCAIGFRERRHHGEGLIIVPALPIIVELAADRYYYQNGFYYRYEGDVWFYSESKHGPWYRLPEDRYPREVHFRGHDRDFDRDREHR